ncbi:MAG: hypothetical protein ACR2PT_07925 [Endozoicomonas sp.]
MIPRLLSAFIVFSATQVHAGFDCSAYYLPESRQLCERFPDHQRVVYLNVPGQDLGRLSESWNQSPELHILPPGTYPLATPLELKAGQAILPHPDALLPAGMTLRTIQLTASEGFAANSSHFYLLKLGKGSSAGGIEIHDKLLPNTEGFRETSLVVLSAQGSTLVSSYITAGDTGHRLNQLVKVASDIESVSDNDQPADIQLARNLFESNNSEASVRAELGARDTLKVTNSILRIGSDKSYGIEVNNGQAQVLTSSLVFGNSCTDGCAGVMFNDSRRFSVVRTTFSSAVAATAIKVTLSPDAPEPAANLLHTNLFSPRLNIYQHDGKDSVSLESGLLYSDSLIRPYPISAIDFFSYTGELGVITVPAVASCAVGVDSISDLQAQQQKVSFNQSGFDLHRLASIPGHKCPPPSYRKFLDVILPYTFFVEVAALPVINIATCIFCNLYGRRLSRKPTYLPVKTADSMSSSL